MWSHHGIIISSLRRHMGNNASNFTNQYVVCSTKCWGVHQQNKTSNPFSVQTKKYCHIHNFLAYQLHFHIFVHINPWRVKCVAIYQSDINILYSPGDHWAQFVLECGKGSHHKIPSSTIINAAVTDSFCKGTLSKTSICVSNNPRMCDASDDMVTWERFSYQQYWPFVRVWSVTRTFVLFS